MLVPICKELGFYVEWTSLYCGCHFRFGEYGQDSACDDLSGRMDRESPVSPSHGIAPRSLVPPLMAQHGIVLESYETFF